VQQGSTNFLISALEIQYPDTEVLTKGWFAWLLTSIGMFFAMAPNVINQKVLQWYFRFAIVIFHVLVVMYWIWFPIKAAQTGGFQSGSGVFKHFYNGINLGEESKRVMRTAGSSPSSSGPGSSTATTPPCIWLKKPMKPARSSQRGCGCPPSPPG
jgi:hypothetical protein